MAPGSTEDEFNIKDGFSDWGAVLISPRAFFAEQAAYSNISGALGFLGAYAVVAWLINILGTVGTGGNFAGAAGGGCCGWLMMSAFMFVWGGIVHMCAKMFGGQAGFAGSFRAATFAAAPYLTLSIVGTLVGTMMMPKPPTRTEAPQRPAITASAQAEEPVLLAQAGGGVTTPGQSSSRNRAAAQALEKVFNAMAPAIIITLLGWVISGVYLVIGVSEIHGVGIGPAIGVVLVANLISWVILGIIGFAIGAAIAGAIAAAMGGAG
jgi:hypothetical protein